MFSDGMQNRITVWIVNLKKMILSTLMDARKPYLLYKGANAVVFLNPCFVLFIFLP